MTHDGNPDAAVRRDRQVERYILALDRGDFDTVAAILAAAENDPDLDRLLVEVDGALHAEAQLTTQAEDERTVRTLLRKHLTSAFAEPETGPPTVGDVAARLQADHAAGRQLLLAGDLVANDQLLGNRTALAGRINARLVKQIAEDLGVDASLTYWECFRRAAVVLAMTRDTGAIHLAAARQRSPRKPRNAAPSAEGS